MSKNISENTFCKTINNKEDNTLWIFGDSHARSITLAGEKVANSLGMNLKLYTGNGTPFPSVGYTRKSKNEIDAASLYDFKILERELIRQIKTGDVILLAIRFPIYFGGTEILKFWL